MSRFSEGQTHQLADALEAAGWTPEDVTRLGQAGETRLTEIRMSLLEVDIVSAIETGKTELWLHRDQRGSGLVQGRAILAHLIDTGLLAGCVDVFELEVIQAKGIEFFRRHFAGKAIFGWRGVQGSHVPYLIEYVDKVVLSWCRLDRDWDANDPGLRRK